MQQNANGLMEPSPLIAALSQAFVKCCRLATSFFSDCESAAVFPPVHVSFFHQPWRWTNV